MKIKIEAFMYRYGNRIPPKYTCDGEELSPGIVWNDVPEGTKSFAILMEDLDVPDRSNTLVLWLVYNIPGTVREIATGKLPEQAQVGINDLGKTRYTGPCPHPGSRHQRYNVLLYALDKILDLNSGATKDDFFRAIKGHILARVEAIGIYEHYKK